MLYFFTLLKYALRQSKTVNLLNTNKSHYITILSKSQKGMELVLGLHNKAKNKLEMFAISSQLPDQILFWYSVGF